MTTYVGGLRARLVKDNCYAMVKQALTDLGWFGSNRQHLPIVMLPDPVHEEGEVKLNTLAMSDEDNRDEEFEMGSNYSEHRWTMYFDFYAEDSSIGIHMINDIKGILQGRFPSIGRSSPSFVVKDLTQTPSVDVCVCQIEDVVVDRAHDFPRPFQRYWYSCRFDVVDYYGDEGD